MIDPTALEAFAASVEASPAWSWSMNQQLATLVGGTVAPTDAFDSVFRLRPPGWRFGMGEDPVDPRIASCNMYQWDGWQPRGCVVTSNAKTLLLGLVACMARAYAVLARQSGWRPLAGAPQLGQSVCVRTAGMGGLAPIGSVLTVTAVDSNGAVFTLSDGTKTDDGNLAPVAAA